MATSGQSALLVAVPEVEDLVANWRATHDPGVEVNIDCHITVLYPFAPVELITDEHLDRVASLVSGFGEFDFELSDVRDFPGVLWLRPEPDSDLKRLTTLVREEFPEYPPYEGAFLDVIPHMTVARTRGEQHHVSLKDRAKTELGPALPVRCHADALSLYTSDGRGMWSPRRRFALGSRATGT